MWRCVASLGKKILAKEDRYITPSHQLLSTASTLPNQLTLTEDYVRVQYSVLRTWFDFSSKGGGEETKIRKFLRTISLFCVV